MKKKYEVYSDGGRLVTRGSHLDRLAGRCLREVAEGSRTCGVYRVDDLGLAKVYDVSRDGGAIDVWRRNE